MKKTKKAKAKFLPQRELDVIRGKTMVGKASTEESMAVLVHLMLLENKLTELDEQDYFGTEGWRHYFGLPEE